MSTTPPTGFERIRFTPAQIAQPDWHVRRTHQRYWLKYVMFGFVVLIDVWWTAYVLWMVRHSGLTGSGFHLDNSVLITLVSTSVGNFLALVAIVAKNLFPAIRKSSSKSKK
jgi:hypothetical protein